MDFENLQVTAHISSPLSVYDDWTPQLEGLVIYQLLSEAGKLSPNPDINQVKEVEDFLTEVMPIKKNEEHGFYFSSSPVYAYFTEEQSRFRKRWSPDQDGCINWGKRRARFETSQGPEKSYDLPLFVRLTTRIDWFCVGDKDKLLNTLNSVKALGKKTSQGFGQVHKWEVLPVSYDWSLVKDNELMKPVPSQVFKNLGIDRLYNLIWWGWKPPLWLEENKALCFMPEVVRQC